MSDKMHDDLAGGTGEAGGAGGGEIWQAEDLVGCVADGLEGSLTGWQTWWIMDNGWLAGWHFGNLGVGGSKGGWLAD